MRALALLTQIKSSALKAAADYDEAQRQIAELRLFIRPRRLLAEFDLPQDAGRCVRQAASMNAITFFRHPADEHFIDNGQVYCPVRSQDIEFDLCAGCGWLTRIDLKATHPVVRCRPTGKPGWLGRPWL